MYRNRIIPVLLLKNWGLEKSIRFQDYVYVGCPINAARVFNRHNVDELILLDIIATKEGRLVRPEIVSDIAGECLMPLTVGGGIRTVEDIRELLKVGADRVAMNTAAVEDPSIVSDGAATFGSQCIVVSIDVGLGNGSYQVYTHSGTRVTGLNPVELAIEMEKRGAGEILLTSIDRDGTMEGYDTELTRAVSDALTIPVIACGGAGSVQDFAEGINKGHASAVAAGAFFLFFGPRRTVLISYPTDEELCRHLGSQRIRSKDQEILVQSGRR